MELRRFFTESNKIIGNSIVIDNLEYNHIVKVLRFKVGFKLIICVGDGYDYHSTVISIDDKVVICEINEKLLNINNSKVEVNLFAAMIKEDNFELVVQKAVELGVYSITPVITAYVSEKSLRADRLEKISSDASKQCGRASKVIINPAVNLEQAINKAGKSELTIMAYEKERYVTLQDILIKSKNVRSIALLIGPEGGFSDEERDIINKNHISKFTLGRRILRAETASIVTLGIIMYELDK